MKRSPKTSDLKYQAYIWKKQSTDATMKKIR